MSVRVQLSVAIAGGQPAAPEPALTLRGSNVKKKGLFGPFRGLGRSPLAVAVGAPRPHNASSSGRTCKLAALRPRGRLKRLHAVEIFKRLDHDRLSRYTIT